jgi:response regulator RpfG family c-di-GMP phosphodiesterase
VKQPLKVLIIDDSEDDAVLLIRQLVLGGFEPEWERVYTRVDLNRVLQEQKWDIILSDYTMPNFSGIDALRIIVEGNYDAPVILVSGAMGEEIAVEAMRGGAQDYLIKDHLARLAPAVERSLREAQNRRARMTAEKALIDSQAKLLAETRQRLQELDHLNHISESLREVTTSEEMMPVFLDHTMQALSSEHSALFIFQPGTRMLKVVQARGGLAPFTDLIFPMSVMMNLFLSSGKNVYTTPDIHTQQLDFEFQVPSFLGPLMALPFGSEEGILGVLVIARERPAEGVTSQEYQPGEINLAKTIAEIGANALQRARFFEQIQVRIQRLSILHEIDLAVSASLSISITLDLILDQIVSQIGIQAADVLLYDPQSHWLEYGAGRGFRDNKVRRARFRLGQSLPGRAVLERGPVAKENIHLDVDFMQSHYLEEEKFSTYFAIPLITKGQIKGVLELFHHEPVSTDVELRDFFESLAAQAAIAMDNSELFQGLKRSNLEITHAYDAVIERWAFSLEKREKEMEGHCKLTTELTVLLAKAMDIGDAQLLHIRRGALLHDIGTIVIPESILNKSGTFTEEERKIIQQHPFEARSLLKGIDFLAPAMDIPFYHHERWDGTGYPQGLKGDQIPLPARIFAVADVWGALTSDRLYRKKWSLDDAVQYIIKNSGTQFDPTVVEVFIKKLPQILNTLPFAHRAS